MNKQDNFVVHGVNYAFDPSAHQKIVNYDWFMEALSSGSWEQETFAVFDSVKDSEKTAIDIGAWIGPTTIWLSKNFKNVIAVEADKFAIEALRSNLRTSSCNNVTLIERPIHSESNVKMFFGSNTVIRASLGDSTSQLKQATTDHQDFEVLTISLDDILRGSKDVSFIKVDIEGGEEMIIPSLFEACSKNGYKLWISFHYTWWKNNDLSRFERYFMLSSNKRDIADFIRSNPFGSLFLSF